MSSDLDVVAKDVWDVVGGLDLPLMLIELERFTVADVTKSFSSQMGVPASRVLNHPVFELYTDHDQRSARIALQALADGLLDFYSARRRLRLPDHRTLPVLAWARSLQFGESHYALAQYSATRASRNSPLVEFLGYAPPTIAVGLIDDDGCITAVSKNVVDVVGEVAESLIGRPLLTDTEQRRLRERFDALKGEDALTVSMPIQLSDANFDQHSVRCVVTCLAETTERCFLLLPGPDAGAESKMERVAQLEHRLWRIAGEVQASGIFDSLGAFPDPGRFPQLSSLNTRQWEVLSRLLRGERVPAIAESLFVSPSTVRNNLSEIFRIFKVHSQSELLHLLNS
ncbi:MAG TPA: helix-turn-helix transcriptional regulator [Acidimicrobiales bacterium]|nr:helix-turn-helix transcriptional regulator [Acidimicrobiales bacterium]